MHSLLERQLRKATRRKSGEVDYAQLLELVDLAYLEHDRARKLQERSMQLMSSELVEANAALRKERDEIAEQSRKRFELAVEGANDGIWDWDVALGTLWFSARCKAILGYRAEELRECSIEDWYRLVHPDDLEKAHAFIRENVEGYDRNVVTLRFHHNYAGERFLMCRVSALKDAAGKVVRLIGAHTDISDIIAMQEELRVARDRAETANSSKSDFLANMSHEIRTPMNAIMGMITLLLETPLSAQQQMWAQIVRNSSESLLDIINDILDISKIEAGKLTLEHIPFELPALIDQTTDTLLFKAQEKNIELLTSFYPHTPRLLTGDPIRLRQVLINLIGNALKFTSEGYVALSVGADAPQDGKVTLHFEVEDTGIGIPPDKLSYVFEKFSQAEESTTRKFGGTGLGLTICRRLVDMMGGTIGVKSEPGKGSTFHFHVTLPVAMSANAPLAPVKDIPSLKLLVADDNPKSLAILREYFTAWNMEAAFSDRPEPVLAMLKEAQEAGRPFHIALIDYHLRGTNGKELAASVRAAGYADVQLVALKGGSLAGGEDLQGDGFDAVIFKPFTPSRLMNKLAILWSGRGGTLAGKKSAAEPAATPKPQDDYSALKVLIVEDILANQIYLKTVLHKYRCLADVASNGAEAVAMTAKQYYDIIFMDCQMPQMDGFEATAAIRSRREDRQPFIVALTADAMQGDRERCLSAGMDEYLNKPVKAEQITRMLRKWLKREDRAAYP